MLSWLRHPKILYLLWFNKILIQQKKKKKKKRSENDKNLITILSDNAKKLITILFAREYLYENHEMLRSEKT